MSEYQLHCFAESGNAYKAALMLSLSDLDWEPVLVDYFKGETRSEEYRSTVNQQGEVPVLVHGDVRLGQSGVILKYLAEQSGKFGPENQAEAREIDRWILFDNHKFTSYNATLRFLLHFAQSGETEVVKFFRERTLGAMDIVDTRLENRDFIAANRLTIADISMVGYLYYGYELGIDLNDYPNITAWIKRIASLKGWQSPYDLMPTSA